MGIQQLKSDLEDIKIYQELTDIMKSIASANFPKMKKYLEGFRIYSASVEKNINLAYQLVKKDDITKEKWDKEILEAEKYNIPISDSLKNQGLESFLGTEEKIGTCIIVISSNQGFCGKFNRDIIKKTEDFIQKNPIKPNDILIFIGRKAGDYFLRKFPKGILHPFPEKSEKDKLELVDTIIKEIVFEKFLNKNIDEIVVIFNSFKEDLVTKKTDTETKEVLFLPIKYEQKTAIDTITRSMIFEPSPLIMLSFLLREYLSSNLIRYIKESETAENYLRMKAMGQASDAVKDEIFKLEVFIRKTRQTTITKELVEIISGAEALKTKGG